MNIQPDVPFSMNDIDATWLTMALRESGFLNHEEVTGFTSRIIGEETGFLGHVAILKPEYSEHCAGAPTSLVLKIPTPLKNRVMGQTMGVYEKEIRFYTDLKSMLKIRSPAHYYSALSVADDPDVVLERLKSLNRQPVWVIAVLAVIVRWIFGLMPRRYVLLIEDVSRFRMGDQLNGCSEQDVRSVLKTMAKLHAQFWASNELDRMSWIAPVDLAAKLIHMMYLQAVKKYRRENEDHLTDRQVRLLDWLTENGIRLSQTLGEHPRTLLHGDFRLDNLCFDDEREEVLVLDWQTMTSGSAGLDLAYFLSGALPLETTEEKTGEMIEHYRQALQSEGVEISAARLRWIYQVGMLAMLHRIAPVLFQDQLELGSDRGPEVMQSWIDSTYRKLDQVDFEEILDRIPE